MATRPSSSESARILLAEDDREMRALLAVALRQDGHEVVEAADGLELLRQLTMIATEPSPESFDLVISDIRLPGVSGLEVLEGLSRRQDLPRTILVTAFGDDEIHERAQQLGTPVFDKPFDIEILLDKVHEMLTTQS